MITVLYMRVCWQLCKSDHNTLQDKGAVIIYGMRGVGVNRGQNFSAQKLQGGRPRGQN